MSDKLTKGLVHISYLHMFLRLLLIQFKQMDADIKLNDWSPETTETRKHKERASLDFTFRDLSYTVGEGKILKIENSREKL